MKSAAPAARALSAMLPCASVPAAASCSLRQPRSSGMPIRRRRRMCAAAPTPRRAPGHARIPTGRIRFRRDASREPRVACATCRRASTRGRWPSRIQQGRIMRAPAGAARASGPSPRTAAVPPARPLPPAAVSVYKRRPGRFSRAGNLRIFPAALQHSHFFEPAQGPIEVP